MSKIDKQINTAKLAILEHLANRYKAGDKNVQPLYPEDAHRWWMPEKQLNCYSGEGKMKCPICDSGELHYSRSSYNGHICACCTSNACVDWIE